MSISLSHPSTANFCIARSLTTKPVSPQSYQWDDDQLVSEWLSAQLDPNNTANSMLLDNIQCLEREAAMARVRHTVQVSCGTVGNDLFSVPLICPGLFIHVSEPWCCAALWR